jgi:hypothetical protein
MLTEQPVCVIDRIVYEIIGIKLMSRLNYFVTYCKITYFHWDFFSRFVIKLLCLCNSLKFAFMKGCTGNRKPIKYFCIRGFYFCNHIAPAKIKPIQKLGIVQ